MSNSIEKGPKIKADGQESEIIVGPEILEDPKHREKARIEQLEESKTPGRIKEEMDKIKDIPDIQPEKEVAKEDENPSIDGKIAAEHPLGN